MAWTEILGGFLKPVGDFFTRRQELKSAERQQQAAIQQATVERQIELIKLGMHADASWELEQIKNSGWKDEFVILVISIPMIGCFIPGLDTYMLKGFQTLAQTPDWYQWLIMLIFTAVYGIRMWRRQQTDT